jgi:hypothetical protein
MKVVICIDDVNPKIGYRIEGEKTGDYLHQLNDEFGCRFTLFIPTNYHKQYPITKHPDWMRFLQAQSYFELAAHGHYHMTSDPARFGECEFAELTSPTIIRDRLWDMWDHWKAVGHEPSGWRNPGWLITQDGANEVGKLFKYVAVHYQHDNVVWPNTVQRFYGHDGIQVSQIDLHGENGDTIMFQSHIAGRHNHNVWNEDNYQQLRLSLHHLHDMYELQFVTLQELL